MNWTPVDALRRWIVVVGLVIGPVLLVLSIAINLTPQSDSMRTDFDTIAAHAGTVVAEGLLEAVGFMVVLASLAGATQALRSRGGMLGTWGAVAAMVGIVGFTLSNANGFVLAELAQLPDRDAAFDTAMAITQSDTAGLVGTVAMVMEILGQLGMLLVIGGLVRARLAPWWLLLGCLAGIVVNAVIGTMVATLVADLLLLIVCGWIAVALARCSRAAWLGLPDVAEPV